MVTRKKIVCHAIILKSQILKYLYLEKWTKSQPGHGQSEVAMIGVAPNGNQIILCFFSQKVKFFIKKKNLANGQKCTWGLV